MPKEVSKENPNDKLAAQMLPAMAMSMLQNSQPGQTNEVLNELVTEILQEQAEARRKRAKKQQQLGLANAQEAAERRAAKDREIATCSHRNQKNETRLVGQRMTGTKQIELVCLYCQKVYFIPADPEKGQEAPPKELIPNVDAIGNLN